MIKEILLVKMISKSNRDTLAQKYGLVEKGKSYTDRFNIAKELGRNFKLDVTIRKRNYKKVIGIYCKRSKKV